MKVTGPLTGNRVSGVFILTTDHQEMTWFYTEVLGLEPLYVQAGDFAFLRTSPDGPQIALYPGRDPVEPTRDSHWFVAFDVPDIEATVGALRELGVNVTEVVDVPGGRAAQFRDPEGNLIEVHEAKL